jgi:murein DD-endopeptidase MepM/ murein hydrolase activator NlpD
MKLALCLLVCLPLKHLYITSGFGVRLHPLTARYQFHYGIDLRASHDTVYAMMSGQSSIGYDARLGIYIKVSDSSFCCTYGHLSQLLAGNQFVTAGTPIAVTGYAKCLIM